LREVWWKIVGQAAVWARLGVAEHEGMATTDMVGPLGTRMLASTLQG
jgi:hypothetical protein